MSFHSRRSHRFLMVTWVLSLNYSHELSFNSAWLFQKNSGCLLIFHLSHILAPQQIVSNAINFITNRQLLISDLGYGYIFFDHNWSGRSVKFKSSPVFYSLILDIKEQYGSIKVPRKDRHDFPSRRGHWSLMATWVFESEHKFHSPWRFQKKLY